MANHENRAENRRKAREAAGETMTAEDLLEEAFSGDDTEDEDENARPAPKKDDDEGNDPDIGGNEDEVEDALKAKTPSDAEKQAEEEAKAAAEAEKAKKQAETDAAAAAEKEKAEQEKKKLEEKPKEAEPGKEKAEPAPKVDEKKEEEKKEEEKPKQLTDEEASKLFGDWRKETETALAEHHYKMTEKDVEEFNENPAAWVPKAMSRVYLDCISGAFQQFVVYLPRMVDQVIEGRKLRSEREDAFYEKWPKLKPHKEAVYRLGTAYRAANPTASFEQFIDEVGAQAMVAFRITPDGYVTETPAAEKKPFTPAQTSSSTPTPPKPKSTNPYEQLAAAFSMEDLPDGN